MPEQREKSRMERYLLSATIEQVNELGLYDSDDIAQFNTSIPQIFNVTVEGVHVNALTNWLSIIASKCKLNAQGLIGDISDGIYYVHSFINRYRLQIYFGDFYKNQKRADEDIANYKLWDFDEKNKEYYHPLNLLVSEFKSKSRFLVVNFNPHITIKNDAALGVLDIINLPWNSAFGDKYPFLIDAIKDLNKWLDMRNTLAAKCTKNPADFSKVLSLLAKWKNEGADIDENNIKLFTNIYRYAAALRTETALQSIWPLVLYIPDAIYSQHRSGIVCNLKIEGNDAIAINGSQLVHLGQSISERLVIFSNMIHGSEISLYKRKGLLPSNNGRPYQLQWLAPGRTPLVTLPEFEQSPSMWDDMFNEMLHSIPINEYEDKSKVVHAILTIIFETMQQLSKPGQLIYASYEAIANKIMDCIRKITPLTIKGDKSCSPANCHLIGLLERLTKSEGDLRFVPAYREHFIHSFHVFILGLTFLRDKLIKEKIKLPDNTEIDVIAFIKMWFLTAIFHDIAYGVEKMESLAENYYHKILLGPEAGPIDNNDELLKPFSFDKGSLLIDEAFQKYLSDLRPLEMMNHTLSRALAYKADHGILSSFALSKAISDVPATPPDPCSICISSLNISIKSTSKEEKMTDAVYKAIALHHSYDKHWDFTGGKESAYKSLPEPMQDKKISNVLLMLLVLCDTLSQAGRTFYPTEQKEIDQELRISNIHIGKTIKAVTDQHETLKGYTKAELKLIENKLVDIIDLIYSPKVGTNGNEHTELMKTLAGCGKLTIQEDPKKPDYDKGGYFEKPRRMLKNWVDISNAEKGIVVRLFVAPAAFDKRPQIITDDNKEPFVYLFPLPL